jgi:organic radical activating enzyme
LLHNLEELTDQLRSSGFRTNRKPPGSFSSRAIGTGSVYLQKIQGPIAWNSSLAHELKVVIFNKTDFAWAEKFAEQVSPECKLYLQPEWDRSQQVTPMIIDYIKQNPKWELSLQLHKYIAMTAGRDMDHRPDHGRHT